MPFNYGGIHKGRPVDPGGGGPRNPEVPLLFECDSIVLSGDGGLEIVVLAGRPL